MDKMAITHKSGISPISIDSMMFKKEGAKILAL